MHAVKFNMYAKSRGIQCITNFGEMITIQKISQNQLILSVFQLILSVFQLILSVFLLVICQEISLLLYSLQNSHRQNISSKLKSVSSHVKESLCEICFTGKQIENAWYQWANKNTKTALLFSSFVMLLILCYHHNKMMIK